MKSLKRMCLGVLLVANVAMAGPDREGGLAELDTRDLRAWMIEQHEARQKEGGVESLAPAPPLTQLQVYAVRSANSPAWEYLGTSQYSTFQNHGGAWMDLVTYEFGYGSNPICQINGSFLQRWRTEYITDAGGTIVGFIYYWIADGHQSGQWTYQNTSTNSPWNTMYDWANVL